MREAALGRWDNRNNAGAKLDGSRRELQDRRQWQRCRAAAMRLRTGEQAV